MDESFRYFIENTEAYNVNDANIDFMVDAELVQSAKVEVTLGVGQSILGNTELKIFHVLNDTETLEGTFIVTTPRANIHKAYTDVSIDCYSTLWLLAKHKCETRYTCKKGTQVTNEIMRIINSLKLKYTLEIEMSEKSISNDIDFEIGTPWLTVFNELLKVINYSRLFPTREGNYKSIPYIPPSDRAITITYDEEDPANIILPYLDIENDFYDVPNVYIRYVETPDGQLVQSYENSNPDSITSTVKAPRNPHAEEVRDASDMSTLYQIAKRDCINNTSRYYTGTLTTAIDTRHWFNDVIQVNLNGINEKVESLGWSFQCKAGADMVHQVRKAVKV